MLVPGMTEALRRVHAMPSLRHRERGVLLIPGHVPHLEQALGRIEEHAVAVDHGRGARRRLGGGRVGILDLPWPFGRQHWIRRVIGRLVDGAIQRRFFDQEVVHEQLPADVDVDHVRRAREVRRRARAIDER